MTANKSRTLVGVVEKAEVQIDKAFDQSGLKYNPNGEYYDVWLSVVLALEDGRKCYFNTPKGRRVVSNAPGCAVVIFDIDNIAAWLEQTGTSGVATAERAADRHVASRIKPGDRIQVRGTCEEKTSRVGKPYVSLKRVKLVG
jgi:hypothetical protein